MEYVVFFGGLFVVIVYWMWRVRRVGTDDDARSDAYSTADHDLSSTYGYGMKHEPINIRLPRPDRVSRESGHGRDGGG